MNKYILVFKQAIYYKSVYAENTQIIFHVIISKIPLNLYLIITYARINAVKSFGIFFWYLNTCVTESIYE